MTKQELYEKLVGIYGGQKELIDDVVNAFNELKNQNAALINALTIIRQKYNNDKHRYRRKAKMYRTRINKAIKVIHTQMKCNPPYKDNLKIIENYLVKGKCSVYDIAKGDSNE